MASYLEVGTLCTLQTGGVTRLADLPQFGWPTWAYINSGVSDKKRFLSASIRPKPGLF